MLPFVNASGDPENEYLSDGMTDELISALANVAGLKVASRTSAFALKGRPEDVRSLGALLGVGTVLEGTVRKAGNRIRLTAQLSDAADGRLLWSERFDREDEDVFAIQDEITATIVRTLRSRLLGDLGEPVPKRYTENPRAYNLYLHGRFAWNQRSAEGMRQAISFFEQAIARGRRLRAGVERPRRRLRHRRGLPERPGGRGVRAGEGAGPPRHCARRQARRGAHLARVGHVHPRLGLGRRPSASSAAPSTPTRTTRPPTSGTPGCSRRRGGLHEALRAGERAVELDPASVSVRRGLGWLHFYARDIGTWRSSTCAVRSP